MLWAQELPGLCWLPALSQPTLLDLLPLPGDRQELSQTITAASPGLPASLTGLWALLVTGQEPAHAPLDFPARAPCSC